MKNTLQKVLPLAYGAYFNSLSLISPDLAVQKAFRLYSSPRKGRVLPQQAKYLNEAKDKLVEIEGLHIQTYQWFGAKETVLLLHGWESNVFRWRNLIGILQEAGYRIIAFDAPGHGYSSGSMLHVPLYAQCLQHLIPLYDPSYIIGHSMGGMTALYHQYLEPKNRLEKIVALGAPSELTDIMKHYQNLLQFNNKVYNGLDAYFLRKFNFRFSDFSTSKFVKNNTKPGLLVHDREDTIAPFRASEKVHAHWKSSVLIPTRGLGHSLHQIEINRQIVDFLKR
ncbi:alpha/beta hydrolase [Arenibacter sp. GZD96]|uniref:alpha/beta fold hydrolase n=1 Tax=Aurantibrevibacter litoralis TaxID=3106030 RepID=UPI002AFEE477|nr:alpha/beta hydrolase [Arenibacter sp. GZD-96]MEA1785842.1 alpha/beta hydrolase [Arenibacter sp. GZD-96]